LHGAKKREQKAMIIRRDITTHLQNLARQFPVVAVMGPRQSGKTTLVKETFPDYEDPRAFFATYAQRPGVIIDEIQEAPELLSYMQGIVDQSYRPGFFVITGSQHFLMYEKITQTLAGRIALLTLLPLSVHELQAAKLLPETLEATLLKGFYPRLYVQPFDVQTWYANYISTYVEKDVRQTLHISDVLSFQRFLKLCAARTGMLVNYASLARDADISPNTAKAWLSILESSYIIKLLAPYHRNFNKRVIKSPKLYFYDPALVCTLLGIRTTEDLMLSTMRGALVETFAISELFKYSYNNNLPPQIYFWRDAQGHEIDAIIEKSFETTVPIEIKAGMTITPEFFKGLAEWQEITKQPGQDGYVVYGGAESFTRKQGAIVAWHEIDRMLRTIYK
jgi:uncharacterized protein